MIPTAQGPPRSADEKAQWRRNMGNQPSMLSFRHLSYEVKTKEGPRKLLDDVSFDVKAGELFAIMGPSGAGKSTLLDLMSFRKEAMDGGSILLNGRLLDHKVMQQISVFVEQEDALLGVLTVRETITYALRLSLPLLPRSQVNDRVERVLGALGLKSCADQIIGNAISRGVSGGQKRRVTAACAMVTFPRILLLDEVTSGLDSTSAREVVSAIRRLAQAEGMMVIASIHQPSTETLNLFTNIIFLAEGKTCYLGPVDGMDRFFDRWGRPVGRFTNPADHTMNFLNTDFFKDTTDRSAMESTSAAMDMRHFYLSDPESRAFLPPSPSGSATDLTMIDVNGGNAAEGKAGPFLTLVYNTLVLCERTAKNYARNLLAYGIRAGMYAGMGVMLALIWIRLGTADSTINDRLSVHFYSVAFLAFMSVAGIPAFLEERAAYYRESKNGLYSTLPFVLSNTIVNIPFLFACTLFFSLICYWAIGLHPGASHFFRFLGFLFLAIVTAESQALIVSAIMPVFVAALAISAFWNGFWMSVGGYFIKARSLPRFWFFSFHFMDYQKYAFELLANSDFRGLTFHCNTIQDGTCVCAYPSSTPESCTVSGDDVLKNLEIDGISYGKWAAIMISITIIYRIVLYLALKRRSA